MAVTISLVGLHAGAALATVASVLVEVPVMLSLVAIIDFRTCTREIASFETLVTSQAASSHRISAP